MKLYTKSGDDGQTGLLGGGRVPKDHARVTAYGEVDELNAVIGLAAAAGVDRDRLAQLRGIQGDLFVLGTQLAACPTPSRGGGTTPEQDTVIGPPPSKKMGHQPPPSERVGPQPSLAIDEARITRLEEWIDAAEVAPLKEFILPGGTELAARFHLARTVCRRAERTVVRLARQGNVDRLAVVYLNRLSDLLFVYARLANRHAGVNDVVWKEKDEERMKDKG